MKAELIHHTPLSVASRAIRKCWASEDRSDTKDCLRIGEKDKDLIYRIGNKKKHSSTLEHLNYSFDIDGISRACLQELARHRHASLSVKSTRYTLKELKSEELLNTSKYCVLTTDEDVNENITRALEHLRSLLQQGLGNDVAKYCLPEAYKTALVWTVNARSLQNFLSLRTSKAALWEIRFLAYEVFNQLPEEHKYLFEEFIND